MRFVVLLILALSTGTAALAQGQPVVRATVSPDTVNVGESAELTVTVLVPTWFTRPSTYPSFELANAITRLPADSSYNIRERIGNESWSGIVRTYEIYPLLGATYRMAGQSISVSFANPGSDPVSVEAELPEVVLRGVVPEGAESLDPYIAGRSLKLAVDVEGDLDDLEAGDAIVLGYRAELEGLPAIFLPPLAPDLEFEGVSVYSDMPDVRDEETARRVEKITLVFEAGGEFAVPGMELGFWNTESRSVETVSAEGVVISVQGPPAVAPVNEDMDARNRLQLAGLIVGSVALVLVLWRGTPIIVGRYREAAQSRRETEHFAFTQLLMALASGDNATAYHALLHWIERLDPTLDARSFASTYGDESLSTSIASLSAGIYGNAGDSGDLRRIKGNLKAARKRYLERGSRRQAMSLPPLNP
jgi:hypothetical protein